MPRITETSCVPNAFTMYAATAICLLVFFLFLRFRTRKSISAPCWAEDSIQPSLHHAAPRESCKRMVRVASSQSTNSSSKSLLCSWRPSLVMRIVCWVPNLPRVFFQILPLSCETDKGLGSSWSKQMLSPAGFTIFKLTSARKSSRTVLKKA